MSTCGAPLLELTCLNGKYEYSVLCVRRDNILMVVGGCISLALSDLH